MRAVPGAARIVFSVSMLVLWLLRLVLFSVTPREGGAPSNPRTISGYWVAYSRAMSFVGLGRAE